MYRLLKFIAFTSGAFDLTDELLDCLASRIGQFSKLDSLPCFLYPHHSSVCVYRNSGTRQAEGYAGGVSRFELASFDLNATLAEIPGSPFGNSGSYGAGCFRL